MAYVQAIHSAPIPGDHMKDGMGLPKSSRSAVIEAFVLESGATLRSAEVGYYVYGSLNSARDNCVIVGHSLTSNSCVHEWWGPLLGDGPQFALDTSRYYVVCVNYLGSVYGTSGPLSLDPTTGTPFMSEFPIASMRDNVRLQRVLLNRLGVEHIEVAIGGSLGGMLALEWIAMYPTFVSRAVLIASCAAHP